MRTMVSGILGASRARGARRLIRWVAAGGVAAVALAACGSSTSSPSAASSSGSYSKNVSMAYAQQNVSFGTSELAWHTMQQQGWKVQLSNLASPSLSLEEAANGTVDLAETNPIAALSAIYHGEGIVVVGTLTNPSDFVLVSPDSITSISQLAGKTVAVNSPASLSNAVVRYLVKTQHLKANIVDIEGGANRDSALEAGRVDAVSVFLADAVKLQQAGSFHVLKSFAGFGAPDQILVANKAWARSHTAELTAILAAQAKSNQAFLKDPQKYVSTIEKIYPTDSHSVVSTWVTQAAKLHVPTRTLGGSNVSEVTGWATLLKSLKLLPAAAPSNGSAYAMFGPLATALKSL